MIANQDELTVTLEQLSVMLRGLEHLKEDVLSGNPELFATLAESSLEDIGRLRGEIDQYVRELRSAG